MSAISTEPTLPPATDWAEPVGELAPPPVAAVVGASTPEESPYRHVYASRWVIHHLLRYHYLPTWPRTADRVFATIDIRTGKIVAGAVFGYPALRSFLREEVFGRLSAEKLNADFRTLVRWMVHPDHRGAGIGTGLLKWAMVQMRIPVIEAINRDWVPADAFQKLGMIHRSDGKRHYYYRLKDCRDRNDEIANPITQLPAALKPPAVARYWKSTKPRSEYQEEFIMEPYPGADVRWHRWGDGLYVVATAEPMNASNMDRFTDWVEVTGKEDVAALAKLVATGLPIARQS